MKAVLGLLAAGVFLTYVFQMAVAHFAGPAIKSSVENTKLVGGGAPPADFRP